MSLMQALSRVLRQLPGWAFWLVLLGSMSVWCPGVVLISQGGMVSVVVGILLLVLGFPLYVLVGMRAVDRDIERQYFSVTRH